MSSFHKNVFINCPFDNDYFPLLKSVLFTVLFLEFEPKIAETSDSGASRLSKIKHLIRASKFSVHDLSRVQVSEEGLPRFNMPFECGIDLGARLLEMPGMGDKKCLILETEKFRYQRFISDISGNDIRAHHDDPKLAMKNVRDWLNINVRQRLTRHADIWLVFNEFEFDYEEILNGEGYDPNDINALTFTDVIDMMKDWIKGWNETKGE
ncbi:MAG: hypothetical protein AAFZ15_13295 [Bacteroidota bacterium]